MWVSDRHSPHSTPHHCPRSVLLLPPSRTAFIQCFSVLSEPPAAAPRWLHPGCLNAFDIPGHVFRSRPWLRTPSGLAVYPSNSLPKSPIALPVHRTFCLSAWFRRSSTNSPSGSYIHTSPLPNIPTREDSNSPFEHGLNVKNSCVQPGSTQSIRDTANPPIGLLACFAPI